jgi:hypothetical protein
MQLSVLYASMSQPKADCMTCGNCNLSAAAAAVVGGMSQ